MSRGRYSVGGPLSQTSAGDCIAIKADDVQLDLAGYSLTGPAALAFFSVGVNVTRHASGATIVGGGATISGFMDGILSDGGGAMLSGFGTTGNTNGIVLSGRGDQSTNFTANGNDDAGVVLFHASRSRLSDFTASDNTFFGVDVLSTNDELEGFTANSNGYAGVVLGQVGGCGYDFNPPPFSCGRTRSASSSVVGGNLDGNAIYGILVWRSHRNRIIGNSASGNGSGDLYDSTLGCDSNQWFGNSFTTANAGCIH